MDIETCIALINSGVGRNAILEVERMGAEKKETIIGKIKKPFSNDDSPFCVVETDGIPDEIFLGEILSLDFA
jgi:hypothetical protein